MKFWAPFREHAEPEEGNHPDATLKMALGSASVA